MNAEFIQALNTISKERGIDKEILVEAVETALSTAYRKNFGTNQNVEVIIDRETGEINVYAKKEVVEKVEDDILEISIEDAQRLNTKYQQGDIVNIEITPKDFGRVAAQTAKQVVMQKIREAERDLIYNEYLAKERDIVTGIIQRKTKLAVFVNFGKIEAMMPVNEQVKNEEYIMNKRIKVYVVEVKQTTKGPQIFVSRTHPELIKRLFEQEVPEIYEGIVEIKNIARDPGSRTKIAVYSKDKDVDPLGACVGQNSHRVNAIVNELHGEKIDITLWSKDVREFVKSAITPAMALAVELSEETKTARVVVPDDQLSLAIGKEGQNVRLAAKLTGWKIDIKSKKIANDTGFIKNEESYFTNNMNNKNIEDEDEYEDYEYEDEE
ncbi:MAG: transcription termination/antitermination protein NusA [Clostridiales bacterium GWE2_32_10]|nr:MAG: transcription termination/antitermination protein NusA [Clostridiales bacterium GWE2_32_10]